MSFRNRTVRRFPSTTTLLIDVFSGRKNIAFGNPRTSPQIRVDHAAVRDDDDVPIGVIRR